MMLAGSCRCEAVRFTVHSDAPYPYLRCYCSICRKIGGSGYSINISGSTDSLKISGDEAAIGVFHAPVDGQPALGGRRFCKHCATALWNWDERWADLLHPFASAIDTPLPTPPEIVHIMLKYKAPWIVVPTGPTHQHFDEYPDKSLQQWHRRHGVYGGTK